MTTTCYKNPSSPEITKFKHETKYEMNTGLKSKQDVIKQVAYQLWAPGSRELLSLPVRKRPGLGMALVLPSPTKSPSAL